MATSSRKREPWREIAEVADALFEKLRTAIRSEGHPTLFPSASAGPGLEKAMAEYVEAERKVRAAVRESEMEKE